MHILVISDIHANFTALQAVLKDAGRFDKLWCLGDVVGYGPDPNECIECLHEFDPICLSGNHDLAVTGKTSLWEFSTDAREVILWTRDRLTKPNLEWLTSLPTDPLVIKPNITLVHASLRDPVWEYIVTREIAKENLSLLKTPLCLNGHTHVPVIFRKAWDELKVLEEKLRFDSPLKLVPYERVFINPGSVGQPRDEDPRAAYAILEPESLTFTYRRIAYDFAATQNKMKQAKFPSRLIRRLRFGQ